MHGERTVQRRSLRGHDSMFRPGVEYWSHLVYGGEVICLI